MTTENRKWEAKDSPAVRDYYEALNDLSRESPEVAHAVWTVILALTSAATSPKTDLKAFQWLSVHHQKVVDEMLAHESVKNTQEN